jgi:tryptophan halogenase
MSLVNQNKMFLNECNEIPFNSSKDTAFHFDATKFGLWLKDYYCKPKGVKHILEDINSIQQDQNGITSLNNKYTADLFVDCTGFKALLLDKTLKEPFDSYSDLLPNNSAWATRIPYIDKEKELVGYTNCTAIENGWVWNIPLWSRIGTGYVYSDKFISDEDALIQFKQYLIKTEQIKSIHCDNLEFKNIKMRVGLHRRLWVKNVVAIGLSAGFIEPLESNGLFTVHEFLLNLVRQLGRGMPSQWDKDNFTNNCKVIFKGFAEFVAMHYAFSKRNDTEYWKHNFNKTWEENLISLNTNQVNTLVVAATLRSRAFCYDSSSGLHCIAAGMNYAPTDLSSLIAIPMKSREYYEKEFKECINNLDLRKKEWNEIVKNKPSLYQFLKDNIYN